MFYSARTDRHGSSGQVAELFQGEPEKTGVPNSGQTSMRLRKNMFYNYKHFI